IKSLGVSSDGDSFAADDLLFTIYPWWDGPDVKEKIVNQLAGDSKLEKKKWVWIYHPPPDNSRVSWDGKRHFGDEYLLKWITEYKPDIVLGGHVHQSPFSKDGSWIDKIGSTWVFNPGRQSGPMPTHIIFEMNHDEALWFSLAGAEYSKLNEPVKHPAEALTQLPVWLT
ncbi:MAG: metallophosphoesterase family protein, partial [Thermodesulfobacteriota bacterium]